MQVENIIVGVFIISLLHYMSGIFPLPFSWGFKLTLLALAFGIPYFKWIVLSFFIVYSYPFDSYIKDYFRKKVNEIEDLTFLKIKLLHITAFISFIYMVLNFFLLIVMSLLNKPYENHSKIQEITRYEYKYIKSDNSKFAKDWTIIQDNDPNMTLEVGSLKIFIDLKRANILDVKILSNKNNNNLWIQLNDTSNFKLTSNNLWKIGLGIDSAEKLETVCKDKIEFYRYKFNVLKDSVLELILESQTKNGIKLEKSFIFDKDPYSVRISYKITNNNDKCAYVQLFNEFLFKQIGTSNTNNSIQYKLLNPKITVFSEVPNAKKTLFGYNKSLPKTFQFLLDDKKDHEYTGKSYKNGVGFIWTQSPFAWCYYGSKDTAQSLQAIKSYDKNLISTFIDPICIDSNNTNSFEEKYYFGPLEHDWINDRSKFLEDTNNKSYFLGFSLYNVISNFIEKFLEKTYINFKNKYTSNVGVAMMFLGALFFIIFILPIQILYILASTNRVKKSINFNFFNVIYFILILFMESRGFVLINKLFCNSINTFMEKFLWIEDLSRAERIPILFSIFVIILNLPTPNIKGVLMGLNQNSGQNNIKRMDISQVFFISSAYCLFKASNIKLVQDMRFCPNYFWYLIFLKIFSPSMFNEDVNNDKNKQNIDNGIGLLSMIIMGTFSGMLRPPLLIFQISKKITELIFMYIISSLGIVSSKN